MTELEIGHKGEEVAKQFLEKQSYSILECNWYDPTSKDEADIITVSPSGDELVIVEVKTRTKDDNTKVELFVTPTKQRAMIRLYKSYIKIHKEFEDFPFRFDVITVNLLPTRVRIKHIQRAITYIPKV